MDLRRPGRAADDGLPAADAQRHAEGGPQPRPPSLAMPGVTDVALVATGVAVRGETFGQCIDAVRALDVDWDPRHGRRPVRRDRARGAAGRRGAARRAPVPAARQDASRPTSPSASAATAPWRPNCAIADVRAGPRRDLARAARSRSWPRRTIANDARPAADAVNVHVIAGRRLVRPQAVLRRRARGGRDLEGDRQAGAS